MVQVRAVGYFLAVKYRVRLEIMTTEEERRKYSLRSYVTGSDKSKREKVGQEQYHDVRSSSRADSADLQGADT